MFQEGGNNILCQILRERLSLMRPKPTHIGNTEVAGDLHKSVWHSNSLEVVVFYNLHGYSLFWIIFPCYENSEVTLRCTKLNKIITAQTQFFWPQFSSHFMMKRDFKKVFQGKICIVQKNKEITYMLHLIIYWGYLLN